MLTRYNVAKWWKMLRGKSLGHVPQGLGACVSVDTIGGYYNDLREKVLRDEQHLDSVEPFPVKDEWGEHFFPTAVFQYGLGAFDLYLEEGDPLMREKVLTHASWALDHQEDSGLWNAFGFAYPAAPYGSMAQGEGASLLLRANVLSPSARYIDGARKAIEALLVPESGLARFEDGAPVFLEFQGKPAVWNGWIFTLFGIYDVWLATHDSSYLDLFARSSGLLAKLLPGMDNGYWSMYSEKGAIASPFYHKLHIALLEAMFLLTENSLFKDMADRFAAYQGKGRNKGRAFLKKAWQKIWERQ